MLFLGKIFLSVRLELKNLKKQHLCKIQKIKVAFIFAQVFNLFLAYFSRVWQGLWIWLRKAFYEINFKQTKNKLYIKSSQKTFFLCF